MLLIMLLIPGTGDAISQDYEHDQDHEREERRRLDRVSPYHRFIA
jgi:hypothetical protein